MLQGTWSLSLVLIWPNCLSVPESRNCLIDAETKIIGICYCNQQYRSTLNARDWQGFVNRIWAQGSFHTWRRYKVVFIRDDCHWGTDANVYCFTPMTYSYQFIQCWISLLKYGRCDIFKFQLLCHNLFYQTKLKSLINALIIITYVFIIELWSDVHRETNKMDGWR